jgi:hypothetical protein
MARLLKQQTSVTVDRLLTMENKLPFPYSICRSKRKFAISVFRFSKQTEVAFFR